ncbi:MULTISPECIES: hypothetical protein [Gammaproteobacteria]|nr:MULTISPECIES: hypothetical protein [Gammaproteobacteria]WKC42254.1 hypothetical protein QYM03_01905 [Shewanella algae]GHZ93248.1 putative membrane protein [Vibrio cholerae]GIC25898.1 putative membrane protein [Vibrio cholerae]
MYQQITKIEMLIAGAVIGSLFGVDIIKIAGRIFTSILIASF